MQVVGAPGETNGAVVRHLPRVFFVERAARYVASKPVAADAAPDVVADRN